MTFTHLQNFLQFHNTTVEELVQNALNKSNADCPYKVLDLLEESFKSLTHSRQLASRLDADAYAELYSMADKARFANN